MEASLKLETLLEKIDALRKEMDMAGPLSADTLARLDRKFRLEMNFHSNRMEGNSLEYGETKSLLLRNLTANGKPLKDHLEMRGHDAALGKLKEIVVGDVKITETLIKEFHRMLLVDPFNDYPEFAPGTYKKRGNYLYNNAGERVDFLPPDQVGPALNQLINYVDNALQKPKARKRKYRRDQYDVHPVVLAAQFHLRFVNIHPFADGNGRLSRLFMNFILMRCGFPPVVIYNEQRDEYYRSLDLTRDRETNDFIKFIASRMIATQEFYLSVANGAPVEEDQDWRKELPEG
ncbi:MAG: Fic family protein [Bacteroidota bacterium]